MFGADAYTSLDDKAAVLLESLVRNHALVDGNKHIGWLATVALEDEAETPSSGDADVRLAAGVAGRLQGGVEERALLGGQVAVVLDQDAVDQ